MRRLTLVDVAPWIEVRFDRASGPGGQNVNKLSTRAALLFDFRACRLLSPAERDRIAQLYAARLARDGRLRIVAQQARTQLANRILAAQRLLELLTCARQVPRPRRATRPTAAAGRRRLAAKRHRGELKRGRGASPGAET